MSETKKQEKRKTIMKTKIDKLGPKPAILALAKEIACVPGMGLSCYARYPSRQEIRKTAQKVILLAAKIQERAVQWLEYSESEKPTRKVLTVCQIAGQLSKT